MDIQEIIYLTIALGSTVFAIYLYFRKPQEISKINDAVFRAEITALTEKFDTRFGDMQKGVVKIMQNDLQEVKADIRGHIENQIINDREVATKLATLTTLLDERLPNRQN